MLRCAGPRDAEPNVRENRINRLTLTVIENGGIYRL
jgi:hypothetical protein